MVDTNPPISVKEVFTLPSVGFNLQFINVKNVTMESGQYICVHETAPQNRVVIIDMNMPKQPQELPITADSALMNPNSSILALKDRILDSSQCPGTTQDHLRIFDIVLQSEIKSHKMPKQVVFWKWISPEMLGMVTESSVYHWSIEGDSEPVKMFDRLADLAHCKIINYKCDPTEKWLLLIGSHYAAKKSQWEGKIQLFSVDQRCSQAFKADAASFAQYKVPGNENPSILISLVRKSFSAGQFPSKLRVKELGAQPGKPSFTSKRVNLLFPPELADDFPVAMHISHKYNLIYVITKFGMLFVCDLETAAAHWRIRISQAPIFLTSEASALGGFYAINEHGQVLLATLNEAAVVPYVSNRLMKLEHALNLATRANLPGAENQCFQELFAQTKYKGAAESPQGLLCTPDTVAKLQTAKEYCAQLGVDACIKHFEQIKSCKGPYFCQGSREDPGTGTGQMKEFERVIRELNFSDAEKTKKFLMEAKLPNAWPLINVCDRFGFVPCPTRYQYLKNILCYIKGYIEKVNPGNTPLVVWQLLDDGCPENFIKGLILLVRSLLPVEPLVEEFEKRNCLYLLTQFLDHLVSEGSQDVHVHNALGKIIMDSNNNPEHFLTTNPCYDFRVVGKYCEKCFPILAVVAHCRDQPDDELINVANKNSLFELLARYVVERMDAAVVAHCRGQPDDELINVANKNSLFELLARYVVERMDAGLWKKVLNPENEYRRQLIDQVVSTALRESKSLEQVHATSGAFLEAHLLHELTELLEKIVLQNSAFSDNSNLQDLLFFTAIDADASRVRDYIDRLDNFDGLEVGRMAVQAQLFEEAFAIFKKFNLNVEAVNVLDNIGSIDHAVEFAFKVEEAGVWSHVAKAQLREGLVSDAIESFIRAHCATQFLDVIRAAEHANVYHDLVRYLLMVREMVEEPKVDSELIYAYAEIGGLCNIEKFISEPNVADLKNVGGRLYDNALYEAAKIIYVFTSNWPKLADTLVKLKQYQGAVDAAQKVNSAMTWKEVCFACVDAQEFHLAQICGVHIIVQVDDLEEVIGYYQKRRYFSELISLMESGLGLERAHMCIFTELGVLYARYRPEKLMEHIKLFPCLNVSKLIRACGELQHWKEHSYLFSQYKKFDNFATTIMNDSPEAWDHMQFKDVRVNVANMKLYHEAIHFLPEHPDFIRELINVLIHHVDHTRVVDIMQKAVPLMRPYIIAVQGNNVSASNVALNLISTEEDDYERLGESIDMPDNFDQIDLAQKDVSDHSEDVNNIEPGRAWINCFKVHSEKLRKDGIKQITQETKRDIAQQWKSLKKEENAQYKEAVAAQHKATNVGVKISTFKTRCTPKRFSKIVSNFSKEQLEAVREMGFETLVKMDCGHLHHDLCRWLVENIDTSNCSLNINGKEIILNPSIFAKTMGIVDGNTIMNLRGEKKQNEETKSKYCVESSGIPLRKIEQKLLALKIVDKEFKLTFTLWALGTILCPAAGQFIKSSYLHALSDISVFREINWATWCFNFLMDGIRKFKGCQTGYLPGCVLFLQLFYLHCVHLDKPTVDKSVVPVVGWTVKLIKKVMKIIRRQGGFNRIMLSESRLRDLTGEGQVEKDKVSWFKQSEGKKHDTLYHMIYSFVLDIGKIMQKCNLKDVEKNDKIKVSWSKQSQGENFDTFVHRVVSFVSDVNKIIQIEENDEPNMQENSLMEEATKASAFKHQTPTPPKNQQAEVDISPKDHVVKASYSHLIQVGSDSDCDDVVANEQGAYSFNGKSGVDVYRCERNSTNGEMSSFDLSVFSESDQKLIQYVFFGSQLDTGVTVFKMNTTFLTRKEISTLIPPTWILDEVINAAVELRTYKEKQRKIDQNINWFLPTHFAVQRANNSETFQWNHFMYDLKRCEKIFIPINYNGNHWYLLVINVKDRVAEIWDSLKTYARKDEQIKQVETILHSLDVVLRREIVTVLGSNPFSKFAIYRAEVSQQSNYYDCGIFVIKYMQIACHIIENGYKYDSAVERFKLGIEFLMSDANEKREALLGMVGIDFNQMTPKDEATQICERQVVRTSKKRSPSLKTMHNPAPNKRSKRI